MRGLNQCLACVVVAFPDHTHFFIGGGGSLL